MLRDLFLGPMTETPGLNRLLKVEHMQNIWTMEERKMKWESDGEMYLSLNDCFRESIVLGVKQSIIELTVYGVEKENK